MTIDIDMKNLGKYKLTLLIFESERTLVYKGHDSTSNIPVIVKVLKTTDGHETASGRFNFEYSLLLKLNHEFVVKPIEFVQDGEHSYIVFSDHGLNDLNKIIQKAPSNSSEVSLFLRLNALHYYLTTIFKRTELLTERPLPKIHCFRPKYPIGLPFGR